MFRHSFDLGLFQLILDNSDGSGVFEPLDELGQIIYDGIQRRVTYPFNQMRIVEQSQPDSTEDKQ